MSKLLGKFCSVANYNEMIMPKSFPGYITPPGQPLKEDGQKIVFKYIPIDYNIIYDLDGGNFEEDAGERYTYTVEDSYIPPAPVKEGYTFVGWQPEDIKIGTMQDNLTFTAGWTINAELCTGEELHELFELLAASENLSLQDITAIRKSDYAPRESFNAIDLSTTSNEIKAWLNKEAYSIMIYSKDTIHCNKDMSSAFKDMTNLIYISDMVEWVCPKGANIDNLFKNCSMLADITAVTRWADGEFSSFAGAFDGTIAVEAGRVPLWYRWNARIKYESIYGKSIADDMIGEFIPGQEVYSKNIVGYTSTAHSLTIDEPDKDYAFGYIPIEYNITYETDGAIVENPKTKYTIEDETYYPPEPYKDGSTFVKWEPEFIYKGSHGDVVFNAKFI